jgi:hypothetical protein
MPLLSDSSGIGVSSLSSVEQFAVTWDVLYAIGLKSLSERPADLVMFFNKAPY